MIFLKKWFLIFFLLILTFSIVQASPKYDVAVDFGMIDERDATLVSTCIGSEISGDCANADVNSDGKIDITDWQLVIDYVRSQDSEDSATEEQCFYAYTGYTTTTNFGRTAYHFPEVKNEITAATLINDMMHIVDVNGEVFVYDQDLRYKPGLKTTVSDLLGDGSISTIDSIQLINNELYFSKDSKWGKVGYDSSKELSDLNFLGSGVDAPSKFDSMGLYKNTFLASSGNKMYGYNQGNWKEIAMEEFPDYFAFYEIDAMFKNDFSLVMIANCGDILAKITLDDIKVAIDMAELRRVQSIILDAIEIMEAKSQNPESSITGSAITISEKTQESGIEITVVDHEGFQQVDINIPQKEMQDALDWSNIDGLYMGLDDFIDAINKGNPGFESFTNEFEKAGVISYDPETGSYGRGSAVSTDKGAAVTLSNALVSLAHETLHALYNMDPEVKKELDEVFKELDIPTNPTFKGVYEMAVELTLNALYEVTEKTFNARLEELEEKNPELAKNAKAYYNDLFAQEFWAFYAEKMDPWNKAVLDIVAKKELSFWEKMEKALAKIEKTREEKAGTIGIGTKGTGIGTLGEFGAPEDSDTSSTSGNSGDPDDAQQDDSVGEDSGFSGFE